MLFLRTLLIVALFPMSLLAQNTITVNDVTHLNPIKVAAVITPTTTAEIAEAVKTHSGPVSIGGGRYSMGGQTATEDAVQIDMRRFNRVLYFSQANKEITVQAGITWRQLQAFIDTFDLSVKIMQTYANFTVGGALSVNCHGRYIGQGPIILSVKEIKLILANGNEITASPADHADLFYGAIGGYGGLGVITEVTLSLTDNCKVERTDTMMALSSYASYFTDSIQHAPRIIFHNADIYPNKYKKVRAISYTQTNKEVTIPYRLKPADEQYRLNRIVMRLISEHPGGKYLRQHIADPITYRKEPVEWRNYEASYDVRELEPRSRKKTTYVLQEYFVPVERFDDFYPRMTALLRAHHVNVINISVRHARKDPGSTMAWAREDVFAFVIYYKQGTGERARNNVKVWTQQLIDAAIDCGGTYYLPYQVHATPEQFARAYPAAKDFFTLKKQYDPTNKFRNKLWDAYYKCN